MQSNTKKLDQLTSLRFFAAILIVIHHSADLFGFDKIKFNLDQGVSFFFVLSGFILSYVYPKLDTWPEIKKFWRARIARVWPAHFVTFLLALWLLPETPWITKTAIANLLLVQGWIPMSAYYFSYNGVSWSVSTEFFFYLAFPFIIYKWHIRWFIKLIFSGVIVIALMMVSNLLSLPAYGNPGDQTGFLVTRNSLLYINPLTRIFEFIYGMCMALAWRKRPEIQWTFFMATSYELGTIMLCAISMRYMTDIAWSIMPSIGISTMEWLIHSGSVFVFGLLIYIMAQGRGMVSRILIHPILILLGEISFSSYLVHQVILTYYRLNISELPLLSSLSKPLQFIIFFSILSLSSYLMWVFIEIPGRRLIVGHRIIHGTSVMKKSFQQHAMLGRNSLLAGLALFCIFGFIYATKGKLNLTLITPEKSAHLTPPSLKAYAGTSFGNLFTLRDLDIQHEPDGLHIKLAWESKITQKLNFTNGIHLVDNNGELLGQADYKQPAQGKYINRGDIWLDTLLIPADKVNNNTKSLGITVYDNAGHMLPINKGTQGARDWEEHILVISLDAEIFRLIIPLYAELFDITDVNWVRGISRKSAGFFVATNPENEKEFLVERVVRLADGQEREILRVDKNESYLYITVSGDTLDAEKVGFPHKIVVLEKPAH